MGGMNIFDQSNYEEMHPRLELRFAESEQLRMCDFCGALFAPITRGGHHDCPKAEAFAKQMQAIRLQLAPEASAETHTPPAGTIR